MEESPVCTVWGLLTHEPRYSSRGIEVSDIILSGCIRFIKKNMRKFCGTGKYEKRVCVRVCVFSTSFSSSDIFRRVYYTESGKVLLKTRQIFVGTLNFLEYNELKKSKIRNQSHCPTHSRSLVRSDTV